jgi:chemotaxis protein CheD
MTLLAEKNKQEIIPQPGFEHIGMFWDPRFEVNGAKILPGEYYVTIENELITTVLGSCISACVRDVVLGIGGMNHFLLPTGSTEHPDYSIGNATRYGNHAMDHLIKSILVKGGMQRNLEVKVFGGGRMHENMNQIGEQNIRFIHQYMDAHGLTLQTEDMGDIYPRKVVYFPRTGKVLVKKLKTMHNKSVAKVEEDYWDHISLR